MSRLRIKFILSDLVREVKKASNAHINDKKFTKLKFEWQEGSGAFSYSHSALSNVIASFKPKGTP